MQTSFCRHCGEAMPAGSNFCPSCGQPVAEIWQGIIINFLSGGLEQVVQVLVAVDDGLDGFRGIAGIRQIAIEQGGHDRLAVFNQEIEGLLTILFGIDQVFQLDPVGTATLPAMQQDQQQRDRGEALLAVHDVLLSIALAEDD